MYQKKCVTSLITLFLINFDSFVVGRVCILQTATNKFCQFIKVSCLHEKYKHEPWLMNEIKSLIKGKNKLHDKYLRKPLSYGYQYRTIRNRLNNMEKMCQNTIFVIFSIPIRTIVIKTWKVIYFIVKR